MFQPNDLMTIKAIHDAGSLTAAAAVLHTSQSALSRTLANLESRIGAQLFTRHARGLSPTEVGLTAIHHAEAVYAVTEAARDQVDSLIRYGASTLRLGVVPYVSLTPVMRSLTRMEKMDSSSRFKVTVGAESELQGYLESGELDILIGPLGDPEPHLHQQALFEDASVIMVRSGHPLASGPVDVQLLAQHRWILPDKAHATRQRIERLCMDAGMPPPNVHIETGDIPLTVSLLMASDYLAAIPRDVAYFVGREQRMCVLDVKLPGSPAQIGLTRLRSQPLSHESELLMRVVIEVLDQAGLRSAGSAR